MRESPVSRQMACSTCAPHEHHLLDCDSKDCDCTSPPIPGVTLRRHL